MQRDEAREWVATGWGKAQTVSMVYDLRDAEDGYSRERRRNAGERERLVAGEGDSEDALCQETNKERRAHTLWFILRYCDLRRRGLFIVLFLVVVRIVDGLQRMLILVVFIPFFRVFFGL